MCIDDRMEAIHRKSKCGENGQMLKIPVSKLEPKAARILIIDGIRL